MHMPFDQPFKAVFDSDDCDAKAGHGRLGDSSNNGIQSRTVPAACENAQPAQIYSFTVLSRSHLAAFGSAIDE